MSQSSTTLARTAPPDRLLLALLAAPFLAQMDATIANVATPSIHTRLHASGAELELVIGGYLISYAMLLVTGARLGQTHGYRRVFVAGLSTFTAGSLVAGLAPTPLVLIAARVVQGAGGALMFPQTLTGIQLHFAGAERVRAIARYAIALSSGAVAGQLLGGVLVSADLFGSGWRAIFLVNVPIGAAVIAAALRFMPDDGQRAGREVDLRGVGTLSVAVLLVVVPLVLGPYQGWPTWTWACLLASLPALGLFVVTERRVASAGRAPLLDFAVLAEPAVSLGIVVMAAATGTYYALLFTLAQYLQQGTGHSALDSGLMVVPWVAAFGLSGQVNRRLREEWAARMPAVGCLALAAVYLAISVDLFLGDHGQARLAVPARRRWVRPGHPVQRHARADHRIRVRAPRAGRHGHVVDDDPDRGRDGDRGLRDALRQAGAPVRVDPGRGDARVRRDGRTLRGRGSRGHRRRAAGRGQRSAA